MLIKRAGARRDLAFWRNVISNELRIVTIKHRKTRPAMHACAGLQLAGLRIANFPTMRVADSDDGACLLGRSHEPGPHAFGPCCRGDR